MSLVEFELAVIGVLLIGLLLKPSTDPHRMQQIADRLEELNKQLDELVARRDGNAIPPEAADREQRS